MVDKKTPFFLETWSSCSNS